jgi:Mg-chelatase subunit ChlD
MLVMPGSIFAVLLVLATAEPGPASEPDLAHRILIRVVGPVALVEVEREVLVGEKRVPARDTVVDLDLPDGAALVDWGARFAGRAIKLTATAEAAARADYARTLSSHQLVPTPAPADDAARVRVHMAPLAAAGRVSLHYRYTVPAVCGDGRFVLRLPASLEENPTAAQVTVRFEPAGARLSEASVAGVPVRISSSGRASVVYGTAPARAAWEVSFSLRAPAGGAGQLGAARAIGRAPSPAHAAEIWAVGLCRPQRPSTEQPADEAMLLVDRSRSVGSGGMSSQRTLVRALLEALPPAQRFNAILFARTATQAFPLPRAATREALAALEAAIDPNQLENGTDLVAALGRAADWVKGGGPLSRGESRLLVIISDGALAEDQTAARLAGALASVGPGAGLRVLVLLVRPAADEPVPADAVERLDKLAARFGGTVRVLAAENLLGVVRSAVAGLAQGGDLFNVRTQGRKARELAGAVAPGTGFAKTLILPTGQGSRVELVAERGGATVRARASAARVAAEWLQPLVETQSSKFWAASLPEVAVFVEMVVPRSQSAADSVVRGQMDPLVLRNALALAFLPRARACYVSRRVANGIDLALRGRVRLELHLERGELEDAIIRRSSLGRPEIEACVREAAFQIEYPRPMFRDAPTVAAVNLVFRPRTPEEKGPADASAFDRELDLILGPVTFDPQKLLQSDASESSAIEKSRGD